MPFHALKFDKVGAKQVNQTGPLFRLCWIPPCSARFRFLAWM